MQNFTAGIFITSAFFLTGATSFVFSVFSSFSFIEFDPNKDMAYRESYGTVNTRDALGRRSLNEVMPANNSRVVGDRPPMEQRRSLNDIQWDTVGNKQQVQRGQRRPMHPQQQQRPQVRRAPQRQPMQQPQNRPPAQRPPAQRSQQGRPQTNRRPSQNGQQRPQNPQQVIQQRRPTNKPR